MQQPPPGSNGGGAQPLPVVAPLPLPMMQQAPPPLGAMTPPSSTPQLPAPPMPPPPPPRAGYRSGGGGEGFSPGQLHVLRHQIMAYRVIKRGELPLPPSLLAAVYAPDLVAAPGSYLAPPQQHQQLVPPPPPLPLPLPLPPLPTVAPLPLPPPLQRPLATAAAVPAPLPVAPAAVAAPPLPPPPPPPHPAVKRRDGPLFHAASDPRVTAVPLPRSLPSALPRGCLAPGVAASLLAAELGPALRRALAAAEREAELALEVAKASKDRAAASAAALRLRSLRLVSLQDSLRSRAEEDYCGNGGGGGAGGEAAAPLLHASERRYRKAARELDDVARESYRSRLRRRAELASEAAASAKAFKSEVLSERAAAAKEARVARNRGAPKALDRAQRGAAAAAASRAAAAQAAAVASAAAAARASSGAYAGPDAARLAREAAEAAAAQALRDAERKARMDALQANDWAKYQQLLRAKRGGPSSAGASAGPNDQERYAAIDKFLNETDEYLVQLTSKVARAKQEQEAAEARARAVAEALGEGRTDEEAAEAGEEAARRAAAASASTAVDAATAAGAGGGGEGGEQGEKGGGGGVIASYHALAHAVSEKIDAAPAGLRPPPGASLRDYQLVGLQWMVSLYNNKLNGILADEMGLGKTVQVMALIAYLAERKQNFGPHLIIVPNAVLVNWRAELTQWLPGVRSVYYVGKREDRKDLFNAEVAPEKFNVLVTTYEFIMRDKARLSKINWKYIVIDEAQRMKDRESKLSRDLSQFRAARRLLLTGTPLQNDMRELWSLLNLLLPDVFDNKAEFGSWFVESLAAPVSTAGATTAVPGAAGAAAAPIHSEAAVAAYNAAAAEAHAAGADHATAVARATAAAREADADAEAFRVERRVVVINRLHQILEPFMLRRQVADVEGKLPGKVAHVVKCAMPPAQAAAYRWVARTGTLRLDPDAPQRAGGSYAAGSEAAAAAASSSLRAARTYAPLNNKAMELRKLCNHYCLSYPHAPDPGWDESRGEQTPGWSFGGDLVRECGKLAALDRMLVKLHASGHRVLLFSTMTRLLDLLELYLRNRLVPVKRKRKAVKGVKEAGAEEEVEEEYTSMEPLRHLRIDGSTALEDREARIKAFNAAGTDAAPAPFIFLLSIRAAGRGLNLQSADTVVIYDPDPNPKNEEQAIARSHRIGQKKEVLVLHLEAVAPADRSAGDGNAGGGGGDAEEDGDAGFPESSPSTPAPTTGAGGRAGRGHADSVETIVRTVIQSAKQAMAAEIVDAGRFDKRTSNDARRATLEELLRETAAKGGAPTNSVPSHAEVNAMLARSPEEKKLFDEMDVEYDAGRLGLLPKSEGEGEGQAWPDSFPPMRPPPFLRYSKREVEHVAHLQANPFAAPENLLVPQQRQAGGGGGGEGGGGGGRRVTRGGGVRVAGAYADGGDDFEDDDWEAAPPAPPAARATRSRSREPSAGVAANASASARRKGRSASATAAPSEEDGNDDDDGDDDDDSAFEEGSRRRSRGTRASSRGRSDAYDTEEEAIAGEENLLLNDETEEGAGGGGGGGGGGAFARPPLPPRKKSRTGSPT